MSSGSLSGLLLKVRGLAVLRGVLDDGTSRDLLSLIEVLAAGSRSPSRISGSAGMLWEKLCALDEYLLPDAWRSHLMQRLLEDENAFSLQSEKRMEVPPALLEQTRRELRTLQSIFSLHTGRLLELIEEAVPELSRSWVPLKHLGPHADSSPRCKAAQMLQAAGDWGERADGLAEYFAVHGAGIFGRYWAFRWGEGELQPVAAPDPINLADLTGYEDEREPLIRNTERFLANLPAHHALLYGLPGTGKSSTVKAVLNEYVGQGLRLVQIAKEDLRDLPLLLKVLRERGPRFIVFVDDLSFEEHEVEYKALKALLEGSIEEPPRNVRLYATSNRRNLIQERFSDREAADDVHFRDTMHEKLSLAARFGLRITFPAPDQQRYLRIVTELARKRGIQLPEAEIKDKALLWERWHPGRSGRTARQFVDELEAGLADGR